MVASMTEAAFYVLAEDTADARLQFVVRLARQIWRKGHQIHCHVEDTATAQALSDAFWADDESFLPNTTTLEATVPDAAITIGTEEMPHRHGVLIHLAGDLPAWFAHFERIIEIVIQTPSVLEPSRRNWLRLKSDGYPITQHDMRS
ncbi:MAG: DNA polymerase III subunit chi [Bacteroidetes bacterium]|nr:DNA polymerase III subunit chi [Bacteroidota bacterium]